MFSLQGKDASKPAGNWFQLLIVLFTKEYLPTSVVYFLVLFVNMYKKIGHQCETQHPWAFGYLYPAPVTAGHVMQCTGM
jgi:hypothetical protein